MWETVLLEDKPLDAEKWKLKDSYIRRSTVQDEHARDTVYSPVKADL